MAATNSLDSECTVPAAPTAPSPPSSIEAERYYYGIHSRPRLVARSSTNVWVKPTGPEAHLITKELGPLGSHPLRDIWEASVGPAIFEYLDSKGVKWTSIDPVRIGYDDEIPRPAIVWIGVVPGSLSAEDGVEIAVHCKGILTAHQMDDVHVEIRESEVFRYASHKTYKPALTSNATARDREPFSTALGLPICAEVTPSIEGTGGFFFTDPRNPGKLYLLTARHVVFHPDKDPNVLYQHGNSSQPRKNVLLFGDAAMEKYLKAIESEIGSKQIIIGQLERRLEAAEQTDEDAEKERKQVLPQLEKAREAMENLEKFLADVSRDWKERENRVLGYVVLSPPIGLDVGEEGFTEDWAVIEINDEIVDEFTAGMFPHPANPPSLEYSGDRLLKFYGTIPDEEMWKPSPRTFDHANDPCIMMVFKRGYAPDLTVGRLNTIRSFTRVYFKGQPGQMSKEVAVLPRNSESGPFSSPGDSGSTVIDGMGRIAGLLTSGAGVTDVSDCTYLTSINFLVKRMLEYGLKANLFLSLIA